MTSIFVSVSLHFHHTPLFTKSKRSQIHPVALVSLSKTSSAEPKDMNFKSSRGSFLLESSKDLQRRNSLKQKRSFEVLRELGRQIFSSWTSLKAE